MLTRNYSTSFRNGKRRDIYLRFVVCVLMLRSAGKVLFSFFDSYSVSLWKAYCRDISATS